MPQHRADVRPEAAGEQTAQHVSGKRLYHAPELRCHGNISHYTFAVPVPAGTDAAPGPAVYAS